MPPGAEPAGATLRTRDALALGLLHGPAELLPISSSAHVSLVPWLLGWPYADLDPGLRKSFEVALHAGTLAALLVGLRAELGAEVRLLDARRMRVLALSSLPPAVAGLLFERAIERRLGTPAATATGLVAGAIAMTAADAYAPATRERGTPARSTGSRSASRRRARWPPASRAAGRRSPRLACAGSPGPRPPRCRATLRCRSSPARPR